MNKKLYVPDHVLKAAKKEKLSKPIENAFKDNNAKEDNKNVEDPSNLEASALERLPQPTGYRVLIIPYYPSAKTKGGLYIPDQTRERESFATVSAYVVIVRRKTGFS